jgi:hypothetical protein
VHLSSFAIWVKRLIDFKARKKLLLTPKATVVLALKKKHPELKKIVPKRLGYGGQIIMHPNQFF